VIERKWSRQPNPQDLLVVWNRTRAFDPIAQIYEAHGARVLVAENGYLDRAADGSKFYALALGSHNGAGAWFVGDGLRFEIQEQPWRKSGSKVLVLPQRGIGQRSVAMPQQWASHVMARLRRMTDREIILRPHPGHQRIMQPIDFTDIHCAVTWGSGAGIKAIREGVPVFHDFDRWIGAAAAAPLAEDIEHCHCPDRRIMWERLSWAQWKLSEIGTGEALDRLLNEEDRCLFRSSCPSLAASRALDGGRDEPARRKCAA
jgi:hypothetical protein